MAGASLPILSGLKAWRIEIITDIMQSKLIIMEYTTEPSFKNASWKEKKAESKGGRQGRQKNKDKEEGELNRKSDKHEKCRKNLPRLSSRCTSKDSPKKKVL